MVRKSRFAKAEAELNLAKGKIDKAFAKAEQIINQSRFLAQVKYEVLGLQIRGRAFALSSNSAKAKIDLEKAVTTARTVGNPAMFLQAAYTFLRHFKDAALLLEAQSLAKVTASSFEDEELASSFLSSHEIQTIHNLI